MTLETRDDRTLFFDLLPLTLRLGERAQGAHQALHGSGPGHPQRHPPPGPAGRRRRRLHRRLPAKRDQGEPGRVPEHAAEPSGQRHRPGARSRWSSSSTSATSPNIRTDAELDALAARGREPVFKAIALRGAGVLETLVGLLELTWAQLESEHDLRDKFGLNPQEAARDAQHLGSRARGGLVSGIDLGITLGDIARPRRGHRSRSAHRGVPFLLRSLRDLDPRLLPRRRAAGRRARGAGDLPLRQHLR